MQTNHALPRPKAAVSSRAANAAAQAPVLRRLSVCRSQMHPGVYKLAILCWAMFMAVFWITFSVSANALFMVVIGTFYALVFFGVPTIMSRMAPKPRSGWPSFGEFMAGRFDTLYGPIEAGEALLQVVLVPLSLGIGGIAIGFIIHSARMGG
jgi:hypothetical protein